MEIIIITLFTIILLAAIWVIYNLITKLENYEDVIDDYEKFIETELIRNEALLEALRQIDNRQMFEKDDEVGSIFYQIKETIEKFKLKQNDNKEEEK
jgi:predicted PurR-regulated permease PerM